MASLSSAPPEVIQLAAPLLFGPLVNWGLYGALCVQIYVYSYNFPDDKRIIKVLAYFVFLLDSVQTVMTAADVYYWFIEGFGDVEHLKQSHFAPIDIPLIHAIISLIIQEYFCYRIWTLNRRSSWLCIVIAVISAVQSIGGFWGGIKSLILGRYAVSKAAFYLWSIPSALADILIAGSMLRLLTQTRGHDGRFPNYILVRVVRLVVETNTLTASVAIASFVLYVAFPNQIYYTFTAGIIGKLYSNTLLVSLNNRIYFRDHPSTDAVVDSGHVTSDQFRRSAIASLRFSHRRLSTPTETPDGTFKLHSISHARDLEKGKGDAVTPQVTRFLGSALHGATTSAVVDDGVGTAGRFS